MAPQHCGRCLKTETSQCQEKIPLGAICNVTLPATAGVLRSISAAWPGTAPGGVEDVGPESPGTCPTRADEGTGPIPDIPEGVVWTLLSPGGRRTTTNACAGR